MIKPLTKIIIPMLHSAKIAFLNEKFHNVNTVEFLSAQGRDAHLARCRLSVLKGNIYNTYCILSKSHLKPKKLNVRGRNEICTRLKEMFFKPDTKKYDKSPKREGD